MMKITNLKSHVAIIAAISVLLAVTSACSQDDQRQHADSEHRHTHDEQQHANAGQSATAHDEQQHANAGQSAAAHDEKRINDFPTYARAEYVYVCMSTNGMTEHVLRQCSCAIDEIAKRMTYDDYVAAETAVRMRQMQGERVAQFREVEVVKQAIRVLKNAQAEAEISCF